MSDHRDDHLPAELHLGDDDVVETMEVLEAPPIERSSGFDGIGTRREGRERALALLFEAEQRGLIPMAEVLDDLPVPAEDFVVGLVVGVSEHQTDLDHEISTRSRSWPLERMPAIDRAILRIGSFELLHTDTPEGVCISEAVELAKRYSTDDSHRFVNGLLAAIARDRSA